MIQWPDRVWKCGTNGLWSSRPVTDKDRSGRSVVDALFRKLDAKREIENPPVFKVFDPKTMRPDLREAYERQHG